MVTFKIEKPTSLTLKDGHGECSIEVPYTGLPMDEMVDNLIIPLLLAAGYHKNTINQWIGEER